MTTAFEDLCLLTGMKALIIDVKLWSEDANYKKIIWKRIETELEELDVKSLGFDYPIYFEILDIRSKSFTKMSVLFYDIFKELFQEYKLEYSNIILDNCKEFIHNEESKINLDKNLHDVKFEKWLDSSEKLQEITR